MSDEYQDDCKDGDDDQPGLPWPPAGQVLHLEIGGTVHAISGIKAGDLVSAQITGTDGKLTAAAIQDPASIP